MTTIEMTNNFETIYRFEVVNELPEGFVVWNIDKIDDKHLRFIPLCQVNKDFSINPHTLKAYEVKDEDTAATIMSAAKKKTVTAKQVSKMI